VFCSEKCPLGKNKNNKTPFQEKNQQTFAKENFKNNLMSNK